MRKYLFGLLVIGGLTTRAFALSYGESSTGLIPPTLDGGRTELEFADINNDGNIDILSIGDHGNPHVNTDQHGIIVWFGDGHGNWSSYMNGEFGYGGIAVGDANNDGKLDVGYGMHHNYSGNDFGDQLIEVALGDGTGRNWTPWDDSLATNGEDWGMFGTDFADIDNDGWLDLISNSFGASAGVHVYRNLQNGVWRQSFGFVGGNSQEDVVFGDINNDGNVDFAVGNENATVCFGDGTGGFVSGRHNLPSPGNMGYTSVALGDVNNDGAKDLALVRGDTLDVWLWNPNGDTWVNARGALPLSGYQGVQLSDMNGDGNLDLVAYGNSIGTVWLGDGAGAWTQAAGFTTPTYGDLQSLRVGGDVDHNGYPDIVLVDDEGSWPSDHNYAHCFKEASSPDSLRLLPAFPRGGERFYAGSVQFIDWLCAVPAGDTARVRLELSSAGPSGPWSLIADTLRNSGRCQWTVPNEPSSNCYVRYIATTRHGADTVHTPQAFTILPSTGATEPRLADKGAGLRVHVSPNPARDRATISYQLPAPGRVRIALHDITGRQRQLLLDAGQPAGNHCLPVALSNLPAGLYLCLIRCESAGAAQTLRLLKSR
jgi:hypothetical protein